MAKRQRFPTSGHASPAHNQSHFQINKGLGAFPISERLPETKTANGMLCIARKKAPRALARP
jgi:hypothetical protein